MQLRLDAADRLVELVEEQRGPVLAEDAAQRLFALRRAPVALARSLLADVVETDTRLAWNGDAVALAEPLGAELLLEDATYVVVDLETTGLRPGQSGICEIGAVRLRGFEIEAEFETLVDPGLPIGAGSRQPGSTEWDSSDPNAGFRLESAGRDHRRKEDQDQVADTADRCWQT